MDLDLRAFGWDEGLAAAYAAVMRGAALPAGPAPAGYRPGRVLRADRGVYTVLTATGTVRASAAGALLAAAAADPAALPGAGDWVVVHDWPDGRSTAEAVLDTPGVRAVGLLDGAEGLARAFSDVAGLIAGCRFADCGHSTEPGCEVREAIQTGRLSVRRWESWHRLWEELRHETNRRRARVDSLARARQKRNSSRPPSRPRL